MKLSPLIEDARVCSYSDIRSNHFLLIPNFTLLTRWGKLKPQQKNKIKLGEHTRIIDGILHSYSSTISNLLHWIVTHNQLESTEYVEIHFLRPVAWFC
jgi:hypothetical protein